MLALATLVGAYVGAEAISRLWLFWIIVPISVAASGGFAAWPRFTSALVKIRKYDQLLKASARLTEKNNDLEGELRDQVASHQRALEVARRQGGLAVQGLMAGLLSSNDSFISGVAVRNDELLIVAQFEPGKAPVLRALFKLTSAPLDANRGLVEVTEVSDDGESVLLKCAHAADPQFWEALKAGAVTNPTPPAGLKLVTPDFSDLPFMQGEEAGES